MIIVFHILCTTLVSTEATHAHCVMCKSNRSNPYIHEPTTCTSVKPLMAHVKQQYTLVNFPLTYTTLSKKFESFHPPPPILWMRFIQRFGCAVKYWINIVFHMCKLFINQFSNEIGSHFKFYFFNLVYCTCRRRSCFFINQTRFFLPIQRTDYVLYLSSQFAPVL